MILGFIDMFSKCHKILVTCDAAIGSFYYKYWCYPISMEESILLQDIFEPELS